MKYQRYRRSMFARVLAIVVALQMVGFQYLPGLVAAVAAEAKPAAEKAPPAVEEGGADLSGGASVGFGFLDQQFEAFGDLVVPVWTDGASLLFVNPRLSATDEQEQELNLGLGYRYLLGSREMIVGGNVYYDARWTEWDNQFNQFGIGAEFLSRWVDARANYYLPEDKEEMADKLVDESTTRSSSTHWGAISAAGHTLRQQKTVTTTTTTLRRTFKNYLDFARERAILG